MRVDQPPQAENSRIGARPPALPNGAPTTDASACMAPSIPMDRFRSEGGHVRAMAVMTQMKAKR
jgi:hypothetical protein